MAVNTQVQLIAVGRARVTKSYDIWATSQDNAEAQAMGICRCFLMSRGIELKQETKTGYAVYAEGRHVGRVIIRAL